MSDSLIPSFWWAMWAHRSGRSPKMSEWANHSTFWANRSFPHFFAKKQVIRSENRWANSQPRKEWEIARIITQGLLQYCLLQKKKKERDSEKQCTNEKEIDSQNNWQWLPLLFRRERKKETMRQKALKKEIEIARTIDRDCLCLIQEREKERGRRDRNH